MKNKARKKAAKKRFKKAPGPFKEVDLIKYTYIPTGMTRAFENNRYTITVYDNSKMTHGIIAIMAMIQRHDNTPIFNHWREMQNIKNEIFGSEVTAIEYYPAENNLIDDKNIYWLWILPEDKLPIYISNETK